jgi:chromosome segregation ATPase
MTVSERIRLAEEWASNGHSLGYERIMEAVMQLRAAEEEIARLKDDLAKGIDRELAMESEMSALRAKLAEAERDARRYRWLRSTADNECDYLSLEDRAWQMLYNGTPDELDAAIDQAMEGK